MDWIAIISCIIGVIGIIVTVISILRCSESTTIKNLSKLSEGATIENLTIINTGKNSYIVPIVQENSISESIISRNRSSVVDTLQTKKIKDALRRENSILIYKTKDESFQFRVQSKNREILVVSAPYSSFEKCKIAAMNFIDEYSEK